MGSGWRWVCAGAGAALWEKAGGEKVCVAGEVHCCRSLHHTQSYSVCVCETVTPCESKSVWARPPRYLQNMVRVLTPSHGDAVFDISA